MMFTFKQYLVERVMEAQMLDESIASKFEYFKKQNPKAGAWNNFSSVDEMKKVAEADPKYVKGSDKEGPFTFWVWAHRKDDGFKVPAIKNLLDKLILKYKNKAASELQKFKSVDDLKQAVSDITDSADNSPNVDLQISQKINQDKKAEKVWKLFQEADAKCKRFGGRTSNIIYKSPELLILVLTSFEASKVFGKDTNWCTTNSKDRFDEYLEAGGVYYVVGFLGKGTSRGNLFQLHFESGQIMDYKDYDMGDNDYDAKRYAKINKFLESLGAGAIAALKKDLQMRHKDTSSNILSQVNFNKLEPTPEIENKFSQKIPKVITGYVALDYLLRVDVEFDFSFVNSNSEKIKTDDSEYYVIKDLLDYSPGEQLYSSISSVYEFLVDNSLTSKFNRTFKSEDLLASDIDDIENGRYDGELPSKKVKNILGAIKAFKSSFDSSENISEAKMEIIDQLREKFWPSISEKPFAAKSLQKYFEDGDMIALKIPTNEILEYFEKHNQSYWWFKYFRHNRKDILELLGENYKYEVWSNPIEIVVPDALMGCFEKTKVRKEKVIAAYQKFIDEIKEILKD